MVPVKRTVPVIVPADGGSADAGRKVPSSDRASKDKRRAGPVMKVPEQVFL
jgi:hypothetical protein